MSIIRLQYEPKKEEVHASYQFARFTVVFWVQANLVPKERSMSRKRSVFAILVFLFSSLLSQFGSVASAQQLGCLPVRDLASRMGWEFKETVPDGGIRVQTSQGVLLPGGYEAVGSDRKILVDSRGDDRYMVPGIWSVYDGKCIGGLPAQSAAPATSVTFVQPQSVMVVPAAGTLPSLPAQPPCLTGEQLARQNGWKILEVLGHGGAKVELPTPDTKVPDGYIVHKDPAAVIASVYPPETNECRLSLGLPAVRPLDQPASQAQAAAVDLTPVGEPEQGLCMTAWDLAARYGWEVVATPDNLSLYGGAVVRLTNGIPIPLGWVFQTDGSGVGTLFPPETRECREFTLGVRWR